MGWILVHSLADEGLMNPIQGSAPTELRSMATSVLKMQLDQAAVDGAAQQTLIEGSGEVMKEAPRAANAPGVGARLDVQG
jgi:hypothetical protein